MESVWFHNASSTRKDGEDEPSILHSNVSKALIVEVKPSVY